MGEHWQSSFSFERLIFERLMRLRPSQIWLAAAMGAGLDRSNLLGVNGMPLSHHLLAHVRYEPPALKAAGDVFDELWAVVKTGVGPDAIQVDLAQEQLAQFLLALAAEGTTDSAELMRRAAGMLQDALDAEMLKK